MMNSCDFDTERRFGGIDRLYGPGALEALRAARATVVGLGGVGAWTAEALARCGVGALRLIDLDHIAESNINRQVHALGRTLGQSKVEAMAERIRDINPLCELELVDDFLGPDNAQALLAGAGTIVDCTDQVSAKIAMILHARRSGMPLVVCGGAGGKTDPLALRAGDLSEAANDALLAKIRNQLRRQHGFPKAGAAGGKVARRVPKMKVRALWVDQAATLPAVWAAADSARAGEAPQGLSCAGYGSVVMVTAGMGLAAANEVVRGVLDGRPR
ncbi:tRNA threonylcarbamoyladenosine dehydratase [Pigmentiphaga humi]|uniref:tRNA threonylcarbamoyladenosine dehydratase n=1 Tax=Pigmentiphaga humi TaxID=2478468 RepID=A0A3P4B4X2_9BURK|nr:tRNA threonylcarbamoyladenosine dehydratase [Pigmentiphaga humi]VCU70566.1 tRNA threonylcarbamoyladenosine dehydratase [Pigmentiphaga humi]